MRVAMISGRPIKMGRASFSFDDGLHGPQHALVFALGVGHALGAGFGGGRTPGA